MTFGTAPAGFGLNHYQDVPWAKVNGMRGVRFRVANSAALAPSINTGAVRTITLAAGSCESCGVYQENDGPVDVSFPANNTGSDKFHILAVRFDWTAKTAVPVVITGTDTGPPFFNTGTTVQPAQVNTIPGARVDGLVALVRVAPGVGTFAPNAITADLRVWGGESSLTSDAPRSYLDAVGVSSEVYSAARSATLVLSRTAQTLPNATAFGISNNAEQVRVAPWTVHTGHPMASVGSDGIVTFLQGGRWAINAYTFSDNPTPGWSNVRLATPGGTTRFQPAFMYDSQSRTANAIGTYPGGGVLRQPLSWTGIVSAGDSTYLDVSQFNTGNAQVRYNAYLSAAYLGL